MNTLYFVEVRNPLGTWERMVQPHAHADEARAEMERRLEMQRLAGGPPTPMRTVCVTTTVLEERP